MSLQPSMFRLPRPGRIDITAQQLALLDLVAMCEGVVLDFSKGQRLTLRHLVDAELIEVLALGPATYRLTPVGRLVRGRMR